MEASLVKLVERSNQDGDPVALWVSLVDAIRPHRASQVTAATEAVRTLTHILARRDDLRKALQAAFLQLFIERKQVSLYVVSGI
ncbi:hypothetical protein, partial [Klebsiella pneumoniae]